MPLGSGVDISGALGVPKQGPTLPSYTLPHGNIAPGAAPTHAWGVPSFQPPAWQTQLSGNVQAQLGGLTQQAAVANAGAAGYGAVVDQNYGAQKAQANDAYRQSMGLLGNGYNRDVTLAQQYLDQQRGIDQQAYARQSGYLNGQYGYADRAYQGANQQSLLNFQNATNGQSARDASALLTRNTGRADNGIGVGRANLAYTSGLRGVDIAGQQSGLNNNQRNAQLLSDATARGATLSQGYGQNVGFSNQQLGIENAGQANQRGEITGTHGLALRDLSNQLGNINGAYANEQADSRNTRGSLAQQLGLDQQGNQLSLDKTRAGIGNDIGALNEQNNRSNADYTRQAATISSIASDYGIRKDQAHSTLTAGLQALGFDYSTTMKQLTDAQNSRNAAQAAQAANIINQAMQIGATYSANQPGATGGAASSNSAPIYSGRGGDSAPRNISTSNPATYSVPGQGSVRVSQ